MIQAVVLLLDLHDGRVRAMMDGNVLTALRTGAASGLATHYLARNDARTAAVFGAGVQGRTQLEAVKTARPTIERAFVFDRDTQAAECFAREMSERLAIEVVAMSAHECLREVDIICTATPSTEPLFDPEDIPPGTHINAVGSYKLTMHEIPEQIVARAKVVVDQIDACLAETADLILPIRYGLFSREKVHAELGRLVLGEIPGRTDPDEITLFKSVGLAIQDLAAATAVLQAAETEGVGTVVEL